MELENSNSRLIFNNFILIYDRYLIITNLGIKRLKTQKSNNLWGLCGNWTLLVDDELLVKEKGLAKLRQQLEKTGNPTAFPDTSIFKNHEAWK